MPRKPHNTVNWLSVFRPALAGLAGLMMLPACSSDVTYAYVTIKVDIDPVSVNDDLRRRIAACAIFVSGDQSDQKALPCTLGSVPYNLGVVDFSSSRSRGTLQFTALMLDLNRQPLAKGVSAPVAILSNNTAQTSILAVSVVPPDDTVPATPDAGSPDADGADAKVTPNDTATD